MNKNGGKDARVTLRKQNGGQSRYHMVVVSVEVFITSPETMLGDSGSGLAVNPGDVRC